MPEKREREFVDFCHHSPELSRDFRGLRAWLPLKLLGAGAFRDSLEEKLDLTAWAAEQLRTIPGLRILADPQLSIVAFRLETEGLTPEDLNALNRRLLAAINARKRVYLTATTVRERFLLRICVLSFRTHRDRMEAALEDIRQAAAEVLVKTA
jgi:aromatic-L-amino-acid decarboxylase